MAPVCSIPAGADTIRLLLTTDNHVGYNEIDPIRCDDAWRTFHEITTLARTMDVDAVIQGGDLFHVSKPLKKSMYQVIRSLRQNCMGDRPCELELLSDPSTCLDSFDGGVNYEDPNLNISVPVFAISGNHDDATGEGLLSPLDVLSATGLINYFGKIRDNENITVRPVLLQKGITKLGLYGMANVRDERLHRAFRDGLVKFQRPNIQPEEWFNLFCIHQNRAQHTPTSCIPETFLPRFLDLVLWGHEHKCCVNPEYNPETGFDVLQLGSSVATSLSEGEDEQKHCFILSIKNRQYSLEAIPLKTVRPLVFRDIHLSQTGLVPGPASRTDVIAYLTNQVEEAIAEANALYLKNNADRNLADSEKEVEEGDSPVIPLPLVRLRVEYSGGYEIENTRRFSNKFVRKIANVNDVVQFYKKRNVGIEKSLVTRGKPTAMVENEEEDALVSVLTEVQLRKLVQEFLSQTELILIPQAGISHAVQECIDNEDKSHLSHWIKEQIKRETLLLLQLDIDNDEIHEDGNTARAVFKQALEQIRGNVLKQEKVREQKWKGNELNQEIRDSQDRHGKEGRSAVKEVVTKSRAKEVPQKFIEAILSEEDSEPVTQSMIGVQGAKKRPQTLIRSSRNRKQPVYTEDMEVIDSDD